MSTPIPYCNKGGRVGFGLRHIKGVYLTLFFGYSNLANSNSCKESNGFYNSSYRYSLCGFHNWHKANRCVIFVISRLIVWVKFGGSHNERTSIVQFYYGVGVLWFAPIHRNVSQKKEFHPNNGMKLYLFAWFWTPNSEGNQKHSSL